MGTFGMRCFSGKYNQQRVDEAEAWLQRPIEWTVLMADRTNPEAMRGSVFGQMKELTKKGKRKTPRIVMTVPLTFGRGITAKTPQGMETISRLLLESSSGKWDAHFVQAGTRMARSGYGDAVIRLGHEMNGPWYPWSSVGNEEAYQNAFRHVRMVLATVSPDFKFEWNVISSGFADRGPAAFPGSDVVDIIGLDIYNKSTGGKNPAPFEVKWKNKIHPVLVAHREFARKHGKPVSYAEWANGSVDEPMYIHRMADWFTDLPSSGPGALYYQCYFNVMQKAYRLENYPQSRAAYAKRFGL